MNIHLARWKDGTFTFFFGQDYESLPIALDSISGSSGAEVRRVPLSLLRGLSFDQDEVGETIFRSNAEFDIRSGIWEKCTKQVWPRESLGN